MSDQETVANMERVWQAIIALGSTFTEQEWKTSTDCPGWTVQDQVAHMLGSESRLLGLPVPDHTPQHTSHVKNEFGQRNEVWVDWYRSWSGGSGAAAVSGSDRRASQRVTRYAPRGF